MSLAEVMVTLKGLESIQELLRSEEIADRNLLELYKEKGYQNGERIQQRIDQYMIQRGQIAEVIDIIDGLKVTA